MFNVFIKEYNLQHLNENEIEHCGCKLQIMQQV